MNLATTQHRETQLTKTLRDGVGMSALMPKIPRSSSRNEGEAEEAAYSIHGTGTPSTEPDGASFPTRKSIHSSRLIHAARETTLSGIKFSDLVTSCLEEAFGEMCAHATMASIGKAYLQDPNSFAERVDSVFGYGGRAIIDRVILFAEQKEARPSPVVEK